MFKEAIKTNINYTRPVLIGERFFDDDEVETGIGTFMILNDEGYVLTCKHIAERIALADKLNNEYRHYLEEIKEKKITEVNKKYGYKKDKLVQTINIFMNCFTGGRLEKIIFHNILDLALIKWTGFKEVDTKVFPKFTIKDMIPGESICRLGFPWPTYNCFEYKDSEIKVKKDGNFETPIFPLDGMITRLFANEKSEVIAFETSTPGLRGQSGGPVFNTKGEVLGIQSVTSHLDLMFDIDVKVKRNHEYVNASEKQFINLGIAISSNQIMKFLDDNNVKYKKA